MKTKNFNIRLVKKQDVLSILNIYSYYVLNTAVSFDITPPDLMDFEELVKDISKNYPYLVVEDEGKIIGYAYTHAYIKRAAYNHVCEITIYLNKDYKGYGLGTRLYNILEEISGLQNINRIYACIGVTNDEDIHLDNRSMYFHAHMGYKHIGQFNESGYKFNKFYDMIWVEKIISKERKTAEFIPFKDISYDIIEKIIKKSWYFNKFPLIYFHL